MFIKSTLWRSARGYSDKIREVELTKTYMLWSRRRGVEAQLHPVSASALDIGEGLRGQQQWSGSWQGWRKAKNITHIFFFSKNGKGKNYGRLRLWIVRRYWFDFEEQGYGDTDMIYLDDWRKFLNAQLSNERNFLTARASIGFIKWLFL
jgi:hypothetical protein